MKPGETLSNFRMYDQSYPFNGDSLHAGLLDDEKPPKKIPANPKILTNEKFHATRTSLPNLGLTARPNHGRTSLQPFLKNSKSAHHLGLKTV